MKATILPPPAEIADRLARSFDPETGRPTRTTEKLLRDLPPAWHDFVAAIGKRDIAAALRIEHEERARFEGRSR